jgi:hypothetical protein
MALGSIAAEQNSGSTSGQFYMELAGIGAAVYGGVIPSEHSATPPLINSTVRPRERLGRAFGHLHF